MFGRVIAVFFVLACCHADQETFECKWRTLAMEYGKKLLPERGDFKSLHDALQLDGCGQKFHGREEVHARPSVIANAIRPSSHGEDGILYVDYQAGSDSNSGTESSPFKTIAKAVSVARSGFKTIQLRGGIHSTWSTIELSPEDSGLTIEAYPGEQPIISGSKEIHPIWKPFKVSAKAGQKVHASGWVREVNVDAAYNVPFNADGRVAYLGNFPSADECESACQQLGNCTVWSYKPGVAECIQRLDNYYNPTTVDKAISGYSTAIRNPKYEPNIYVADLSSEGLLEMPGLMLNGQRAFRARYPNCNPETDQPDNRLFATEGWLPPKPMGEPLVIMSDVLRNDSAPYSKYKGDVQELPWFSYYTAGIGGACSVYDPPVSYWCSNETQGGGAFTYVLPGGMQPLPSALPNSPYKKPTDGILNIWRRGHWANWMFEIESVAPNGSFVFGKGGFQGSRGGDGGADWFIENVLEELDAPNEYYYDKDTKQLYYFHNGTGAPPTDLVWSVPFIKTLLSVKGTRWNPVRSITIRGVEISGTAYTYMDPHAVPSGGDWALERMGALFFEGTEHVTLEAIYLHHTDGNGLMVSGYNRYFTLRNSELTSIGGTAVALWGYTNDTEPGLAGSDGTDGNHPRYTFITNNLIHEVGLYEKQASFFMQAKSCLTTIDGNVFFNGPRAGINFNDGFGGGNVITNTLVLNTCRQSSDHGPFNSWDRVPFLTDVRNGTPSYQMAWNEIHHNFLVANYESSMAVDNDDGSAYYKTHDNFMVGGLGGMKNDYGGHDNWHYNNIYSFVGQCFGICTQIPGHGDYYFNNTCVTPSSNYGHLTCNSTQPLTLYDNSVYNYHKPEQECGEPFDEYFNRTNNNKGTVFYDLAATPDIDEHLIKLARDVLGL